MKLNLFLILMIEIFSFNVNDSKLLNEYLGNSSKHLFYFIHVTDIHVTHFGNSDRINEFEEFCNEIIKKLIQPKVTVVTGDLTHNRDLRFGSQQYEIEWKIYRNILQRSEVTKSTLWLDMRGNHDTFMDHDPESNTSFYRIYSEQGQKYSGSYRYEIKTFENDSYSFIGMDLCPRPGPGRPFNFIGQPSNKQIEKIKKLSEESNNSTATIYFGHYPLSFVHSRKLIEFMKNGLVYLNGHLHLAFGKLYFRHSDDLLQLELADWKDNRRFRLITIDSGLISFEDLSFNQSIFAVISNPKPVRFQTNREPIQRILSSSHIRILIFSKKSIKQVQIFIDSKYIGLAQSSIDNSHLFILQWNPNEFNDEFIHRIRVEIQNIDHEEFILNSDFSVRNMTKLASIEWMSNNWILRIHWPTFGSIMIATSLVGYLFILIYFRYRAKRMISSCSSCFTIWNQIRQRMIILCSVNLMYKSLIYLIIYHFLGPWYIGYLTSNHFGFVFLWGTIVAGNFLSPDMQLFMGTIQLFFFVIPLTICLSSSCFYRFTQLHSNSNLTESKITRFIRLFSVYFLFVYSFLFLLQWSYTATASYQLASILSPFGIPLILFTLILYFKSRNLNPQSFSLIHHKDSLNSNDFNQNLTNIKRKSSIKTK